MMAACAWGQARRMPAGITSLLNESHYKKCITLRRKRGELAIERTDEVDKRRKHFGKNLLFCANPEAESGWIIEQYRAKDRIEDDFKLLKAPELIRWRPCRHWTDTKIRAFGFCCVMALVLIRVMELKAARAGLRMSPYVLKEELADLQEITTVPVIPKNCPTFNASGNNVMQRSRRIYA